MVAREVRVFRGVVRLGSGLDEVLPGGGSGGHRAPLRWLERSLAATAAGEPRSVYVMHRCQSGGGLEYFARFVASYRPGPGQELRLRVGVGDRQVLEEIQEHEAGVVLAGFAGQIEGWPERPTGDLVVDHAVMHPVDTRDWAWRAAARLAAELLRPGRDRLDDEGIQALGLTYLRDQPHSR